MTRREAGAELERLAFGLHPDNDGMNRLLERLSVQADAAMLRDVLVERGARAVLQGATP